MQEQIFKDLEKLGHKFSKIEQELEMPSNYLSRFKNPENVLPKKWIEPLQTYIQKHLPNEASQKAVYPLIENEVIEEIEKTKLVVEKNGLKEKPSDATMDKIRELNAKINKDFGEGTVMLFGDRPNKNYEVISTGSLLLDNALGIGGLPRGRMIEIFGAESSGKTTIALHVMANAQKAGLKCLLVDAENAFDPEYASALGINLDELDYCQPDYGEQALEVADRKILTGNIGCVVIDSVAALVPKAELEGQHGESRMGLHARLMSQACRKMVGSIAKTNTLMIFINQIRNKIGVMWESPEVTTGGLALQFYASIRLRVSRSISKENSIMNGLVKEGNQTTVKVIKNKCSPPFTQAQFDIIYGKGISKIGEIVDLGSELGVINKGGSWYSYESNKLGQGRPAVIDLLESNPELAKEIEDKINAKLKT